MLTTKQEQFAQNIISGMSQADAYRSAYAVKKMTDKTVWESASKLLATPKVSARVAELRERMASESIMTAKQRLEFLTNVINGDDDINAKLKAIDIMNKMQGEYVQKVEADVKNEVTINIELSDDEG